MPKYTFAFSITPLPHLIDKYPNIINKSRVSNCIDEEKMYNCFVYTNDIACYLWYHLPEKQRFDNEDIIKIHLQQMAKTYFNYDEPLTILFSVYSFNDELSLYLQDRSTSQLFPRCVRKFEVILGDILNGNTDPYDIWNDKVESEMDRIIPEESKELRSWDELLEEMKNPHISDGCFFNSQSMIIKFLPYFYAKRFLKEIYTHKAWNTRECIPYTRDKVIEEIRDRYNFLNEKIKYNRGLSVEKAMIQLKTLCWLLKEKEPNHTSPIKMKRYINQTYIK